MTFVVRRKFSVNFQKQIFKINSELQTSIFSLLIYQEESKLYNIRATLKDNYNVC